MPTPDGHIGSRDLCTGAVVERTIADGGVSSLKISASLQSDNWNGSQGWYIDRVTGSCNFQDATIRGTLNASDITTGYIDAAVIEVRNINATEIKSGSLSADRIATTALNASNISSGSMSADYISGGTISGDLISGGTISGGDVTITNLNASNITSGTISTDRINASTLSALSGNTGTLTVNGWLQTTTGGGFRTSNSGNYVEIADATDDRINFRVSSYGTPAYIQANSDRLTIRGPGGSGTELYLSNSVAYLYGSSYAQMSDGVQSVRVESSGIRIYHGGSVKLLVNSGGAEVTGSFRVSSIIYGDSYIRGEGGNVSAPGFSFEAATSSGMYTYAGFTGISHSGNAVIVGNGVNQIYASGVVSGSGNLMYMDGTQIKQDTSSERNKHDIEPAIIDEDALLSFAPVWFRYNDSPDRRNLGWTAEQVYDVAGDPYVHRDDQGRLASIDRNAVATLIVEKIRQLDDRMRRLEEAML